MTTPPARPLTPRGPERLLVLGATSALGRALAEGWAAQGKSLILAARSGAELDRIASDLRLRFGVEVGVRVLDVTEPGSFIPLLQEMESWPQGRSGIACVVGHLGDPPNATHPLEVERILRINLVGPLQFLNQAADRLANRGEGFIIGIASVAGDRGRPSNYVYGAAKGGFAIALEGLRHRLAPRGVQVLTVKPGFLDTAMTYGRPGIPFAASPRLAARRILQALHRGRREIYVPGFWLGIMTLIRCLPDRIMRRL